MRISLIPSLFFLGACASGGTSFSKMGNGTFDLLGGTPLPTAAVLLPLDRNLLVNADQDADGSHIRMQFHNIMELDRQGRFSEARFILSEIRETLTPDSDGYKSVTCSIALTSLKAGDYVAFNRAAHQLDLSLGEPVNVPVVYVEVISLYRSLVKKTLPVNVPEGIKQFDAQLNI